MVFAFRQMCHARLEGLVKKNTKLFQRLVDHVGELLGWHTEQLLEDGAEVDRDFACFVTRAGCGAARRISFGMWVGFEVLRHTRYQLLQGRPIPGRSEHPT